MAIERSKTGKIEVPMNVTVPADVARGLDVFCKRRKVMKKAVIELALRRFLADEGIGADGASGAGAGAATDGATEGTDESTDSN